MKVLVYNLKGGVGKTSISLNLALHLKYGIITNDIYSPLENVVSKKYLYKLEPKEDFPNIPDNYNVVFDFGGYLDSRVIEALKKSDFVLIPIISNFLNIQVSVNTIEEIKKYNSNIILIANKTVGNDFEEIVKSMKKLNYNYPIFQIKQSKAMEAVYNDKKAIIDMMKEGGLRAYSYKQINSQFKKLVNYLEGK